MCGFPDTNLWCSALTWNLKKVKPSPQLYTSYSDICIECS